MLIHLCAILFGTALFMRSINKFVACLVELLRISVNNWFLIHVFQLPNRKKMILFWRFDLALIMFCYFNRN